MILPTKEEIIKTRGQGLTPEQLKALGERNKRIVSRRKKGATQGELAREFNLSPQYIRTILHKYGVYGPVQREIKKKVKSAETLSLF